ncbi:MAG: MgtC/SapB family protein [Nitrospiraceae bacterium]|nr:MgtC/SapB family protein [Nitrospiraceae bacterium]
MSTGNWDIVIRLLIGAVMGGIIGFEREAHSRPAGFRTHLLVCISGVLIMTISHDHYLSGPFMPGTIRVDPGRIVSGAITGIGFLGGGVIIKTRGAVHGLTTAACIWIVFALGLATGSGLYMPAVIAFLLTFFTLWTLRIAENKIPRDLYRQIEITADEILKEDQFGFVINEFGHVLGIEYEKDNATRSIIYRTTVSLRHGTPLDLVLSRLSALNGAKQIKINMAG